MNNAETQTELFQRLKVRLNVYERERIRGAFYIFLYYVLFIGALLAFTYYGPRFIHAGEHFVIALVGLGLIGLFFRPEKMERFRNKARDFAIVHILQHLNSPLAPGGKTLPLKEMTKSNLFKGISFSDWRCQDVFSGDIAGRLVGFSEITLLRLRYSFRYKRWQRVPVFRGVLFIIGDQKSRPIAESRLKDLLARVCKNYRVQVVGDHMGIAFADADGILEISVGSRYNSESFFQRFYNELSVLNQVLFEICAED